jgi:hypothetical protein
MQVGRSPDAGNARLGRGVDGRAAVLGNRDMGIRSCACYDDLTHAALRRRYRRRRDELRSCVMWG